MAQVQYDIIKNCFAGRKGYTLWADPNSQKAQRLEAGGFIKRQKAEEKKPKAEKREKKVTKPKEQK